MIMQPDFVTDEIFYYAKQTAFQKKKNDKINDLKLEISEQKLCLVYKHIGSYDDEPKSFVLMEQFLQTTEYKRISKRHREIYLSDFRKTEKDKLKTILCVDIDKK